MGDSLQEQLQGWSYRGKRHQTLTRLCASRLVYPLYAGVAVLALRRGTRIAGADVLRPVGGVLLAKLVAKVLHRTVIRPRPFVVTGIPPLLHVEPDNGFPSDHALQIGALLTSVWILEPRLLPVYSLGGVLTLAARLGAGVHHTSDVVAGVTLVAMTGVGMRLLPLPGAWEQPLRAHRAARQRVPGSA